MMSTYLYQKLGNLLQQGLSDPFVTEIILNPDSQLWFHRHGDGYQLAGTMHENEANNFVHALAESALVNASGFELLKDSRFLRLLNSDGF